MTPNVAISRLRNVLHLSSKWNADRNKMIPWQQFIKVLFKHLQDVTEIENFYFTLLEDLSGFLYKQNAKRAILDGYLRLLNFEGRIHKEQTCFICEEKIQNNFALNRAFLPSHTYCTKAKAFNMQKASDMFKLLSTAFLDDNEVKYLYNLLMQGL